MKPLQYYHVRPDEVTGEMLVVKGDIKGDYEVVGPVNKIPSWYGLPFHFTDAAANADDSYFILGSVTRDCANVAVAVQTYGATISLDGGTTDHLTVLASGVAAATGTPETHQFNDILVPAGSVIAAKNAVATEDYIQLFVMVW